jgi:hypothetical protein
VDNGKIINTIKHSCLLAALCVAVLPAISVAQQYYDPGLLQKTIDRKPVEYQSPGIRLGRFLLQPSVELAWENNDNIFYIENKKISDSIIHIRPELNLKSDWSRHSLNFSAYADIAKYNDFGSEDYEDWAVSLDGRIDVKRKSAFSYTASYVQLHENRSSPDDVGGIKPTEFTFSGFDVGYIHTFNRLTADLIYDSKDTDYSNNLNSDGDILDNQDRDRTRDALALRMSYEIAGQRAVFIGATRNRVDYDQAINNDGVSRSSDGYGFQGGLSFDITGLLVGDMYLQYLNQKYDNSDFNGVDGFGLGAGLNWTPTRVTNINLRFANTPQETTQSGTSGYFSSLYSVRIQHELRRSLLANLRFSYTDNNYQNNGVGGDSLDDTQVYRYGIGLSYLINRHIDISSGYFYEKQRANSTTFEYTTNHWFVTLGFEL